MKSLVIVVVLVQLASLHANPLWNQTLPENYDPEKFEIQGDMIVLKVLPDPKRHMPSKTPKV